jgi:hypothetical protein
VDIAFLVWWLNIGLMVLIVSRGVFRRLVASYPVFYLYLIYQVETSVIQMFFYLSYGYESPHYYHAVNWGNLAVPLLHLAVVTELVTKSGLFRVSSDRLLQGFLGVALLAALFTSPPAQFTTDWFYRFHAVMLPSQVIACAACYACFLSRKDVDIGRNLAGILLGVSLLVAAESINYVQMLYSEISFATFRILVPASATVMLIVFTHALWNKTEVRVKGAVPAPARKSDRMAERAVFRGFSQ